MSDTTLSTGNKVYLVAGRRTPFGKFGGSLSKMSTLDLALPPCRHILDETGVDAKLIEHIIVGNVVPSKTDTIYLSRHLAIHLGCEISTPAYNLNRLCGSGIQSILDGYRMIKYGEHNCVLAGGAESMSTIPHAIYGSRFGTRFGSLETVDFLMDTLTDKYTGKPMAITAENMAKKYEVSRKECDEFALASHLKAKKAYEEKLFKNELTPLELKKSEFIKDEHLREDAKIEQMNKLRSAFIKDGVVTAANASGIVDGAAFVMLASEKFVKENNLNVLCEIVDFNVIGVDPNYMGIGPVPSIKKLLDNSRLSINDIDYVEINEAFAAQVLSCQKELGIDEKKLNVWGGAIALGHPLGATGSRITLTAASQLNYYKKRYAIASACIGGGQGISVLLKNINV
ncbi:MAG: thiolase family protein [Bacteriovoracaceae bacterium]|jgi:acetyl-CoA C-acetyltransferase/acetyl-CoA acyltransferase 2|nr:thiolase family protein [Bacteriovoracaceae bacterium]